MKEPSPLPSNIVTVLLAAFATARSRFPSPLKSPVAMKSGLMPVAGLAAVAVNVPSPLPSNTVRYPGACPLTAGVATTRSGTPSLLKSPVAIACVPTVGFEEFNQPNPVPAPNVAVVITAFALLVSRNDTVPGGSGASIAVHRGRQAIAAVIAALRDCCQ